jgi:ATP-dependent protease ClpP protease subunit
MKMADSVIAAQQQFLAAVKALEKKRKSRIFCIIHDLESNQHICGPEMNAVMKSLDKFEGLDTLEILLHSGGGHADVAYRIARFFRGHCKRLNFIVPIAAKSAATLMCLAGDALIWGN